MAYLREFNFVSALLRLTVAVICGGVIGYGRSKRERSAGLRTYILVCVGGALTMLLTTYQFEMLQGPWKEIVSEVGQKFDALRIGAQTITGIGFLGAGIIIKGLHQQVNGLTTATGLFVAVGIGLAAGTGFYELAIISTLLVVLVLNVLSPMEGSFKRRLRNMTLNVEFHNVEDINTIVEAIEKREAKVYEIDVERSKPSGKKKPSAIFILQMSKKDHSHSGMLSSIAELPCVYSVQELVS